jgi:hypothetical protein
LNIVVALRKLRAMAASADSVNSTAGPARRIWPWRWLVPSMTHWLWLVILLILLAQPWRTMMTSSDGDACMHWRVGEWMLQHGQILRSDVFSHTRFGQPFISKEWLSEIIYAAAGRWSGLYGLCVVAALVIATTFALLHFQLVHEGNDLVVATVVTLAAMWASSQHWLARPHVFSFLAALLWNNALRRFECGGSSRWLFVNLGVLTLLWVNLHGAFLAGFIILGAYWLGAATELWQGRDDAARIAARHRLNTMTVAALLCAVVSLINPNGFKLHLHNIQFLRSEFLRNWLAEYRSTDFHLPAARGFLVWLALMFFTLALARPRVSASEGLLLISWTYFALYSARNVPLLAILTAPILTPALSEALRSRWRDFSLRMQTTNAANCGWPVVGLAAFVTVVFVPHPTEMLPSKWPVSAVAYIQQNPDGFRGNMFNQYVWGGYLMHTLPEHRVFVDGRTDFYGEALIRQFDATASLSTNWMDALVQYNVSWTLMPTTHRLNLALALLPGWKCVYSNQVATIFRKTE